MEPADSARPSLVRDRPPLPLGPRTRNYSLQNQSSELGCSSTPRSLSSSSSSQSRLESPILSSPLAEETLSPDSIPPSYAESPTLPVHSSMPKYPDVSPTSDVGIQADIPPAPTPIPETKPVVKAIPKPSALTPPPPIKFDLEPISFKGLSLEAARWTLSSSELQEIVSRAIRLSARESFIRLLSIETLDKEIVEEIERLETLRITTQSKYRFQVHRRTMTLQAINSSALAVPSDPDVICNLAIQLSDITQACDRFMEELLRIADQQAQLAKVQDLHWASSLAVALRKINKSYERKTHELQEAKEQVEVLNVELEEAWKEAEKIALEMDDLEIASADGKDSEEEDEDVTTHTAHVVGVTGTALATPAKLMVTPGLPTPTSSTQTQLEFESLALKNSRSRRQSSRSDHSSKWDQVAAAKARSRRTSDASLRLTKRSRSKAGRGSQPPPIPMLPGGLQQDSFLDLNIHPTECKPHPFSVGKNAKTDPDATDTKEERDGVAPIPFPLIRHDSGCRSSSKYSKLKPRRGRHSVPMPALSTAACSRSETP